MIAESKTPTAFAVICHGTNIPGDHPDNCPPCGRIYLTKEEYERQLSRPDSVWMCPRCTSAAEFDDETFERGLGGGMKAKTFEIRDDGTFIPVLAVQLAPECDADRYLLTRSGYGANPRGHRHFVVVWPMSSGHGTASSDPYAHGGGARTMPTAHEYIEEHFDELESGAVVDVEFIKGETSAPKIGGQAGACS